MFPPDFFVFCLINFEGMNFIRILVVIWVSNALDLFVADKLSADLTCQCCSEVFGQDQVANHHHHQLHN